MVIITYGFSKVNTIYSVFYKNLLTIVAVYDIIQKRYV
jgi:hypothetical protein